MAAISGGHHRPTTVTISFLAFAALLILTALYFLAIDPIPPWPAAQAGPAVVTSSAAVADPLAPTEQAETATSAPAPVPATQAPAAVVTSPAAVADPPASTELARTTTPAPASSTGQPGPAAGAPACAPNALMIPDLGVDAPVVQIGLDRYGSLGVPSDADKSKAGWYPSTLAGAPHGSVILTGHTYHDETAIFRTDFNHTAHRGMAVRISCPGAAPLSYRVTEAKLDLGVADYAAYVDSRRLYATDGPPQVVIITCTNWNPIRHDYDQRGILIATPAP